MKKPWRTLFSLTRAAAVAGALLALAAPVKAGAATWSVDPAHTKVNFSVNHFMTPVTGSFEDFEIDLTYDSEHPEKSKVKARIKTASVNTGNKMRDEHLRSADWFEAATKRAPSASPRLPAGPGLSPGRPWRRRVAALCAFGSS